MCHGDIKAENVLLTSWGWVLLADWASYKPTYLPADNPVRLGAVPTTLSHLIVGVCCASCAVCCAFLPSTLYRPFWPMLSTLPTFPAQADFSYYFDTGSRRRCYLAPERFFEGSAAAINAAAPLTPEMVRSMEP